MTTNSVQCTRCRNTHVESDRPWKPSRNGMSHRICPRCGGRSYYDLAPRAAWCFADGIIEFGEECDLPDGAILIARGPRAFLSGAVGVVARHGYTPGVLLVPGVPEAENQIKASEALDKWLSWAGKENGTAGSHGVTFIVPPGERNG